MHLWGRCLFWPKEKPRRLNTPGPSSEYWLAPSVSQRGRVTTTPFASLCLRGNDSQELKKLLAQGVPELSGPARAKFREPKNERWELLCLAPGRSRTSKRRSPGDLRCRSNLRTRPVRLREASDLRFCRLQTLPHRKAKLPPPMPSTRNERFCRHGLNTSLFQLFSVQTYLTPTWWPGLRDERPTEADADISRSPGAWGDRGFGSLRSRVGGGSGLWGERLSKDLN